MKRFLILNKTKGFTLLEILIVIALLVVIAMAIIVFLNPMQQINKARDSKKKSDLNVFKKTLEDYYNDKSCYPKPSEVCYNAKAQYAPAEAITCNICGSNPLSPSFTPYLTALPCDPESPKKEFLYQVDDLNCPKWFKVYSELGYKIDPIIDELGCTDKACGPKPFYGYDFGVTSSNIDVEKANSFYCLASNNVCNPCGTLIECKDRKTCQVYNKYYTNSSDCCTDNNLCAPAHCTDILTGGCFNCGYSFLDCYATGKCVAKSAKPGLCP
ncbi:MAG: type II secretion system protein [Patescibacteria group bacterium]|jgi:prepilin-type N-terminal cleavage/methylation domain-containing protein